jgi:hypothetical protein
MTDHRNDTTPAEDRRDDAGVAANQDLPRGEEVIADEDLTLPGSLESIEGSPASPDPEDPGDPSPGPAR